MKKLCIFDFDGTLFDTLPDVATCFNQTFQKLGYEALNLEFYKKSLGGNIDEILAKILKENNTPENIEEVKSTYEKIYHNNPKENTKIYAGIHETLNKLQEKGYILAINSNRDPMSIKYFLNKYTPNIKFIDIQGHVSYNPSKPDPYGANTIIKKANVTKEETIYIGDSHTDIQTAKNANIDCILVTWGYGVGNVYQDKYPVKIINKTEEITDFLD